MDFTTIIYHTTDKLLFTYGLLMFLSYLILGILSAVNLYIYIHKNKFIDYSVILSSEISPTVSILAPAYNEEKTIVENARSLLSIQYVKMEVIIINDGSSDNSLIKLIEHYNLEKVDFAVNYKIHCEEILGVYKSKNEAFHKLTVIDKINGGKSDALNAGINISKNALITSIDVDCVIEQDAILKMVKPFLEETNKTVIASGGVVRVANNCEIELGRITKVHFPNKILAGFQVLEYYRAFILGRMAWSKLNGLLLISGAFGMFRKDIVIAAGGYNHNTVGEDMELVVRMRRYMHDTKQDNYIVSFIPDPLCWTEVPENFQTLSRQRNRWTRGTIETLAMHKEIFMNPKYKLLGLISYPYWLFFEWFAPYIEFFGFIYFVILLYFHKVNFIFFFTLLAFVYSFAMMFSLFSIFFEEATYNAYKKKNDILKMIVLAMLEPLIYHPLIVLWAIKGNISYLRGEKNWGKMERTGFSNNTDL